LIFGPRPTTGIGAPLAPIPFSPFSNLQRGSSIPLTARGSPTIVNRVPRKLTLGSPPRSGARRYAWVCLLLAFLFLYNPYLSALGSPGGLNVEHPASHRATVGSSELERYSPTGKDSAHVFVTFFFANFVLFPVPPASHSFPLEHSELLLLQRILCASLWFRPPPFSNSFPIA
jgi:hypothetical protein